MMLHLPAPHLCPACAGVHKPARAELPAAAELRPYFATFIQLIERHVHASFTLPALSSGGGTDDATYTFVSNSLGASGSGSKVLTVGRAGTYTIQAGLEGANTTGNSETLSITLLVGGVSRDTHNVSISVSSKFGGYLYYHAVLAASDTIVIRFSTTFDAISGNGSIVAVFQPLAGAT